MEIILCECDWDGLGPVPAHYHTDLSLVRRQTEPYDSFWIPHFIPQAGYDVLQEVKEIHFSVPWKDLYRASC